MEQVETLAEGGSRTEEIPPISEETGLDTGMQGEVTLATSGDVLKVTQEVCS